MYEDTEGQELDYINTELPELPLLDKAKQWGISVKAIPGNYQFRGYYSSKRDEIALATPEERVFFHELAHASHEMVKGSLNNGQDPLQEIVAELSAQALCRLVGKQTENSIGNSFRYIERYARKIKMTPYLACLKVLTETEKVLTLILKETPTGNTTFLVFASMVKESSKGRPVSNSREVYNVLKPLFAEQDDVEKVYFIFLDAQNRVLAIENLFTGSLTASAIYVREVVKKLIILRASGFIVAHNHPSGDTKPSDHDKSITNKLAIAAASIDVQFHDHIIIGDGYCSMADNGWLKDVLNQFSQFLSS